MKTIKFLSFALIAIGAIFALPALAIGTLAALPVFASVTDLERYANNELSSFDGDDDESFEGGDEFSYYDGEGDDFLDFNGGRNFMTPGIEKNTSYTMTLVNAAAATRSAYLTPGYYADTGTVVDGAFNDISSNAGLTGSGSPKGVKYFHAFLEEVPCILNGFQVKSTDATQLSQTVTIEQLSPFRNLEDKPIILSSYTDQHSFNDKIVDVPTPGLVLGAQTRLLLPVVASSTCIITFWIGAMLNNSKALQNKAGKALSSIGIVPTLPGGNKPNVKRFMPPRPRLIGRK